VKRITKISQGFATIFKMPKDHRNKTEQTKTIRIPPPKGVPAFQLLNLSKRGVGLLNISTVCWFFRLNFTLYKKSMKGIIRIDVIKSESSVNPSN
jgi:hypothetical protein